MSLSELEKRARIRSRAERKPTLTSVRKAAGIAIPAAPVQQRTVLVERPLRRRAADSRGPDPIKMRQDVRRTREALDALPELIKGAAVAHAREAVSVEAIAAEAARRVTQDRSLIKRITSRLPFVEVIDGDGKVTALPVGAGGEDLNQAVTRLESAVTASVESRSRLADVLRKLVPARTEKQQPSPQRQRTPDEHREHLRAKYNRPTDDENFEVWLEHTVAEYAERTGQ